MFAGMQGGLGVLFGSTGGYIVGFLFAGLIYWGITGFFGEKLWVQVLAMGVGLLSCYFFGTVWFMAVYIKTKGAVELLTVLGWCVFPFIIPDCIKIGIAVATGNQIRKQVNL